MKAAGVRLPNRSSAFHCGTNDSEVGSEVYYLLAYSAGYEFKNRLVSSQLIQSEF